VLAWHQMHCPPWTAIWGNLPRAHPPFKTGPYLSHQRGTSSAGPTQNWKHIRREVSNLNEFARESLNANSMYPALQSFTR
jgi:hypothetical protein